MQTYDWPGNVRELANCIEHALVLCDELPIHPETPPAQDNRVPRGKQLMPAQGVVLAERIVRSQSLMKRAKLRKCPRSPQADGNAGDS